MTPAEHASALADLLDLVFVAMWFVAMGGWAWAFWHFMPMWRAGFKKKDQHNGYLRKVLVGSFVFVGALVTGMIAIWSIEALGLRN